MVIGRGLSSAAQFLNVDLDIYSRHNLQPLVSSLGKKVTALYVGRNRRKYCAHLEVSKITKTADSTIRAFCELIQALPRAERHLWNAATVRSFSIGVQAGKQPTSCDFAIKAKTVKAVSELGAQIVLTVYAPKTQATSTGGITFHEPRTVSD
jgi:hypothetical protein